MDRPLVFVTDYGRDDSYAASLIGAAWAVQPGLRCVDGTHGVPPGDVLAGAYHLKALRLAFDRCVLCAVVDPGVGTSRRAIAAQLDEDTFCVAPDNGLITYLWLESEMPWAVTLEIPDGVSSTFHGRDVFAPAAAQIAGGEPLEQLGDEINDPMLLDTALARRAGLGVQGQVAVADHFGNAITTIRAQDLQGLVMRRVSWEGGSTERVVSTYEEMGDDELGALIGSAGHVEIAARGAPAAGRGGPQRGMDVVVET